MTKPTTRDAAKALQALADLPILPPETAAACKAGASILSELGAMVSAGEYPQDGAGLALSLLTNAGIYTPRLTAHEVRALAEQQGYTLAHGGNPAGYFFHMAGLVPEKPQTFGGIVEAWAAIQGNPSE